MAGKGQQAPADRGTIAMVCMGVLVGMGIHVGIPEGIPVSMGILGGMDTPMGMGIPVSMGSSWLGLASPLLPLLCWSRSGSTLSAEMDTGL